jgi:uncharacterized protein (TIGR03790 family)
MSITQSNVVFVYNSEDPDGIYFAKRYADIHNITEEQLIGIDTETEEIVDSFQDFKDQLETPLRNKLLELKDSGRNIYAIVLGWRIPGGFWHNGKIISATSRISAIAPIEEDMDLDLNKRNPLYNRGVFKRYDEEDSASALVVTRLDAPIKQVMDRKFDEISTATYGTKADGLFYFDLYSGYGDGERASQYQERLDLFDKNTKDRLSIPVEKTVKLDDFTDVFFGQLRDDSIYWGWGFDAIGNGYFFNQSRNRTFFYNADFNSLRSIRSFNVTYPGVMAIDNGYVAVAGAMDEITRTDEVVVSPSIISPYSPYDIYDPYDPYTSGSIGVPSDEIIIDNLDPYFGDELNPYEPLDLIDTYNPEDLDGAEGSYDIFLDPIPFFDSVLRGAKLGESFLFSNPFLNNSMSIFGDPLMPIDIENTDTNLEQINVFESFDIISEHYAKAYSYLTRRAAAAHGMLSRVVDTCEIDYATTFITPSANVASELSYDRVFSKMTKLGQTCQDWATSSAFNLLPPKEPTFVEYLYFSEQSISDLFLVGGGNQIQVKEKLPERLIYSEGSWMFEAVIQEMDPNLFFLIQFELLISLSADFEENDIIFDIRSVEDLSRWEYEEPFGVFTPLTYWGVPSNLKGRRIRFRSDEFQKFTRFTKLYIKYRQVGDAFFYTPYTDFTDIVSH